MNNKIFVFGDSHASTMFRGPKWPHLPEDWPFFVFYLPERTAFKLENNKNHLESVLFTLKETTEIILVFGEIDCRAQIYNQFMLTKRPIDLIISEVVSKYTDYVRKLVQTYKSIHVMPVVPTGIEENIHNIRNYPDYGVRCNITMVFNMMLEAQCAKKGINFIDIYHHLLDDTGDRRSDLVADDCHLNHKVGLMVYNYIRNNNNEKQ